MPTRYAALCSDFYVNQRLSLKMDLPLKRDTVLGFFDRLRREHPRMNRFRRYQEELALESGAADGADHDQDSELIADAHAAQQWAAVRRTSVRSGVVGPIDDEQAFALHRSVLESAPYYLDISALDIEHVEVLLGFDLASGGNHDAIVMSALLDGSPMAALAGPPRGQRTSRADHESRATGNGTGSGGAVSPRRGDHDDAVPVDCQPVLGLALNTERDLRAHFEVKTRSSARAASGDHHAAGGGGEQPISVYLIVRKYGPFRDIADLPSVQQRLIACADELMETKVVPHLLTPLRSAIAVGG